jgi:hypothetical protein
VRDWLKIYIALDLLGTVRNWLKVYKALDLLGTVRDIEGVYSLGSSRNCDRLIKVYIAEIWLSYCAF